MFNDPFDAASRFSIKHFRRKVDSNAEKKRYAGLECLLNTQFKSSDAQKTKMQKRILKNH